MLSWVMVNPSRMLLISQNAINRTDKYSNINQISSCDYHFFLLCKTTTQTRVFYSGIETCDVLQGKVVQHPHAEEPGLPIHASGEKVTQLHP